MMPKGIPKNGINKGWFKNGNLGVWLNKKRNNMSGKNNPAWKGKKASYTALHIWIASKLGKPHFCEHCGRRDLKHRQYNWANISGKYKRVLSDWIRLCAKCHKAYDKKYE